MVAGPQEVNIQSSVKNVRKIIDALEQFCHDQGIPEDISHSVTLATDEAVTNIVLHAYKNRPGEIKARFTNRENILTIELVDTGDRFTPDPNQFLKPEVDLDDTKEGGFGLFIIKNFVDECEFGYDKSQGQNQVVLRKKLTS